MKIEAKITNKGIERKIDFQGATLPDGRSIDEVLNENKKLNEDINKLDKYLKDTSSILTKWIPNKKIRILVEIILMLGTIIGITQLFF